MTILKIARCLFAIMLLSICMASNVFAQKDAMQKVSSVDLSPQYSLLNIGNITAWFRADGVAGPSPSRRQFTSFPRGTAGVVYQDGFWWGGKVYLDSALTKPANFPSNFHNIRVGGAMYSSSARQGRIIGFGAEAVPADSTDPSARIYRIRRDYFAMTADELRADAAELFETTPDSMTAEQINSIREQYAKDWREWPVQFGAPFIDRNSNGRFDPPPAFSENFTAEGLLAASHDEPGIAPGGPDSPADQVIWMVFNDLARNQNSNPFRSNPFGLEVRVTVWGYKSTVAWGGYYLKKIEMFNKSGVELNATGEKGSLWIDSMYVGQWSDPDIGDFGNDLVGCDTLRQMGFAYNGHGSDAYFQPFDLLPPAVGYCLVRGPRIASESGWQYLPMTGFTYYAHYSFYEPPMTGEYYKMLRGFAPVPGPNIYYNHPPGTTAGPFPLSGDPVARTGHIDGQGRDYSFVPGDRRLMISSGPFTLAPGDSQEVIIAFVAGIGSSHLAGVSAAKLVAGQVRSWYPYRPFFEREQPERPAEPELPSDYLLSQNYPNPFNASTRIDFALPKDAEVRLAIFDVLGREVVVLLERPLSAGTHSALWDGRDAAGNNVPSGHYFYKLQAGHIELSRGLTLIR